MANAIYAQSGGVTSVINASAAGVINNWRIHNKGILYAAENGILGVLNEELIDTTSLTEIEIKKLRQTPGVVFGSCRYKLKSLEQSRKEYERIIEVFAAYNIEYFFYNGGNDSEVLIDEIIKNLNLSDLQIIVKINEDRDSMANLIRKNKEQYGVMLFSQAINKKNLKIVATSDFEVNYQALAIAGENMKIARGFLKFLKSDIAKKIFIDNGFIFK